MFRIFSVVVLSIMLAGWNVVAAQDSTLTKTKPPSSAKSQGDPPKSVNKAVPNTKTSEASGAKKRSARLPRYFGQLELSSEQKDSVYSIQAEYASQIADLIRQIDMLKAEREKQLKAILSASQKRKLTSLSNRTAAIPKPVPKEN